jgi:hypothetical protein
MAAGPGNERHYNALLSAVIFTSWAGLAAGGLLWSRFGVAAVIAAAVFALCTLPLAARRPPAHTVLLLMEGPEAQ